MSIEQEAARNLINRAMDETKQHIAYMLIESAGKLDASLYVDGLKNLWLEKWLIANKDRSKQS